MMFEITPIAAILIPLGIFLFFFAPNLLYWCMVFSLPFSATAVANLGFMGASSGVQAAIVFGSLWIVAEGPKILKQSGLWQSKKIKVSVRQLRIFILVVVLSLIMPLWIHGRVTVDCPDLLCNESAPLTFSFRHITQTIYLAYGIIIMVLIAARNVYIQQFRKSIRVFLISAICVSFWGMLQWYCYHAGISYPAFIFNSSKTESALGYLQELGDLGIPRISSVATEPSMLAQFTLIALVFAIFAVFTDRVLISKFWDRIALAALVLILLLTTSSTAYIGLAILLPVSLVGLWYLGRLGAKPLAAIALGLLVLFLLYARSQLIQAVAAQMIFSKAEDYSGIGRLNSVLLAFNYFRSYPLLGIGWGSATSYDLIVKLLSNTGILGLFTFAVFITTVFSRLWKSMKPRIPQKISERTYWACCLLVASFMLIFTNELTGFAFVYGHLWFILGMALAVPEFRDPSIRDRTQQLAPS
jgi:O-Antigen ligase